MLLLKFWHKSMNVKGWMHTWMASHPWHTHI